MLVSHALRHMYTETALFKANAGIKLRLCDGAVQTAGKGHQVFNMMQLHQLDGLRQVRV